MLDKTKKNKNIKQYTCTSFGGTLTVQKCQFVSRWLVNVSALFQNYLRGVYLKYEYVLFSRTDLLMRILSYKDLENPPNYDSGGSPGLYQTKQK